MADVHFFLELAALVTADKTPVAWTRLKHCSLARLRPCSRHINEFPCREFDLVRFAPYPACVKEFETVVKALRLEFFSAAHAHCLGEMRNVLKRRAKK